MMNSTESSILNMFTTMRPDTNILKLITTTREIPIIISSIIVFNILFHGIGLYLLLKTYTRRGMTTQQMLILHLSVCEFLSNCVWLVIYVLLFLRCYIASPYGYCICTYLALKKIMYILIMLMTIDRLAAVLLNFRYRSLWNTDKTKKTLFLTWLIGALHYIAYVILYRFQGEWYIHEKWSLYSNTALSIFYVLLAAATYSVLFWKYMKSRKLMHNNQTQQGENESSTSISQTFLKSRFYVSVLIVFTYLIFDTIPSCAAGFLHVHVHYKAIWAVMRIFRHLNCTSDAIIYIFLQKDVRKELFKCISRRKYNENNDKLIVKRRDDFPLQSATEEMSLNTLV